MAAAARGSSARRARTATTGKGHRVRTLHSNGQSDRDEQPGASVAGVGSPGKQTLTQGVPPAATAIPATGYPPLVQRRAGGGAPTDASVPQTAAQGLGAGSPLPDRARMEAMFGADFGDVRVHTGDQAAAASRAIGAEAYTMGNDIVLGGGGGAASQQLLAHELTHVVQQRAGAGPAGGVGKAGDHWEQEADGAAAAVSAGRPAALPYGPGAQLGGAVQRVAVQRYESGEHAQIGSGMNYPYNISELALPNGARATTGELVAFGDFYADMQQLRNSPRQETEALVGLVRLEAIWQLAERQKRNGPAGGSATTDPPATHREAPSPDPSHHADARHLETAAHVDWADSVWDATPPGCSSSLRQRATEIHAQFSPAWEFFGMPMPLTQKPNMNIAAMRATLGRRRFRGTNDSLGAPGTADPGHQGGDYFDLAANNVSHFAVSNWASWQAMHERACLDGADPTKQQGALAEDALGAHFLTDQFAAGHLVDKQELMTFATSMVVQMAEKNGRAEPGDDRDATIRDMPEEALQQCFDDDAVYQAWVTGCQHAHDQGLIRRDEMELMTSIPRGNFAANGMTVVGQIVNTIMAMPWRNNFDPSNPGAGADRSRGPADAPRGGGDYHLGMGNLAALQVHEALNHIGFLAINGNNDRWHMQGDGHLTAETQRIGQLAVQESQRQVQAGKSEPDKVKQFTPTKAKMLPDAFEDFFSGQSTVTYDPTTLGELRGLVRAASATEISLIDTDGKTVSPQMRDICHGIMRTLFTAHPSDQQAVSSGTGLNISMLRAFLLERLPDMVAAAYAAADVGDLPQAAQEAYVPRDAGGAAMPTAANDFRWSGDKLDFKLNVTGCAPGSTFPLGLEVHDLDAGFDVSSTGQRIPDQTPTNTDDLISTFTHPVTIPAAAGPSASGSTYIDVSWTMAGRGAGDGDAYVMVFADRSCQVVIGRSQERSAGGVGNPHPRGTAPRVTGPDAIPSEIRATGVVGNAFVWDGPTLRFRVNHNAPRGTPETSTVKVWYRTFNKDADYDYGAAGNEVEGSRIDDPQIGGLRQATANIVDNESSDILITAPDNEGDTYVVVYADAAAGLPLGRSNVQGMNRGALGNQRQASPATATSGFSWSGAALSFAVSPAEASRVWVKFFDEDFDNDHDAQGNRLPGSRNEDPQIGGIHAITVTSGRGTILATGDADNAGDTYAIVYADAACTQPIGRSSVQP